MNLDDNRSLTAILRDIFGNLEEIVRNEIRLAQIELREEVLKVARAGVFIVLGGVFGIVAIGFLLWAGVYLLAQVVALWVATLIVAVGAGAVGAGLIAAGVAQMKRVTPPSKTINSLRETVRWEKAPNN